MWARESVWTRFVRRDKRTSVVFEARPGALRLQMPTVKVRWKQTSGCESPSADPLENWQCHSCQPVSVKTNTLCPLRCPSSPAVCLHTRLCGLLLLLCVVARLACDYRLVVQNINMSMEALLNLKRNTRVSIKLTYTQKTPHRAGFECYTLRKKKKSFR